MFAWIAASPAFGQTGALLLADANGDGEVGVNETVRVTARLFNPFSDDLRFTLTPPLGLELVPGTVALGKRPGRVVVGNGPGDTRVEIAFDPMTDSGATGSADVIFDLRGDECFPMAAEILPLSGRFTASDPQTVSLRVSENVDLVGSGAVSIFTQKSDGGATTSPGGTVSYTVSYRSGNPSRLLDRVRFRETVPDYTVFDASSSDPRWSCDDGAPAGSVCELLLGDAACGTSSEEAVFGLRVVSSVPAGVDRIVNTVETYAGGSFGPFPATDTTPLVGGAPDLAVAKTGNVASTEPGGVVRYTVTWRNDGSRTATGVEVIERVPQHATFHAGQSTPGWSCADGAGPGTECRRTIGTLDGAGASGSAAFAVRVVDPLPAGLDAIENRVDVRDDGAGGPDPTPGNNTALVRTPIADGPESPGVDLAITKTANRASVVPGDSLRFDLSWTNRGRRGATGVTVTETVPAHTTFDRAGSSPGWSCADGAAAGTTCTKSVGILEVGESETGSFAVRVVSPLPAGVGALESVVTIADDGSNGPEMNPADNTASARVPVAGGPGDPGVDLVLAKAADRAEVAPGEVIVYTLSWRNDGARGASGVVLEDVVPEHTQFLAKRSDDGWSCPNASVGGSICRFSVGTVEGEGRSRGQATLAVRVVLPLPAGVSSITNRATIDDDGSNGREENPADNEAEVTTPIGGGPGGDPGVDLVIEKAARSTSTGPGQSLIYDFYWRNDGVRGATGVVVRETVPMNTTFDASASDARWQCDGSAAGSACTLTVNELPGGGQIGDSAAFGVVVDSPLAASVREIANTARIDDDGANGPEADPSDNVATVRTPIGGAGVGPDLAIRKADDRPNGVGPGERITYSIEVENLGNVGSRALVEETVPMHSTFVAAASSPGWSCDGTAAGSRCVVELAELAGGGSIDLVFAVDVVSPLPADAFQVVNEATVEALDGIDTDPANNRAVVVTPIRGAGEGVGPDLFVDLDDGGAVVEPGDGIAYRIVFGNEGNRDATSVRLEMAVPAGTVYDGSVALPDTWSCADGDPAGTLCTLTIGGIGASDESRETGFGVRVEAGTAASGRSSAQVNASVRITGEPEDIDPTDNVDTETTPIERPVGRIVAEKHDVLAERASYAEALETMGLVDSPGVIEYHVAIEAVGGAVDGGVYRALPIADAEYLRYVPGSVAVSAGTVERVEPEGFIVVLGDLADGEVVTITFAMAIDPSIPPETEWVACQGVVTLDDGRRFLTDDPETVEAEDPTRTPLDLRTLPDPVDVPTLGTLGGLLLAGLLAFAGTRVMGSSALPRI